MMKNVLFSIIAFLLSLFLAFLVAEGYLRITNQAPVKSTWLEMHERGFMMNRASADALYTLDDRRTRKRISEYRTRGDAPNADKSSIFVLGDSFTFGLLLDEEHTITSRLNELADQQFPAAGVEFINAGVGGTGFADWVAQLQEIGDEWPVEGILILHNYDDFLRMLAKNLYVAESDSSLSTSLRWTQHPVKARFDNSGTWKFLQERSRLFSFFQNLLWSRVFFDDVIYGDNADHTLPRMPEYEFEQEYNDYAITLTNKLYGRLSDIAASMDVPLWVGTTGYLHDSNLQGVNRAVFNELPGILSSYDIPYADITPSLSSFVDGDFDRITIPRDTHPTEEGAELIAHFLWEELLRDLISERSP